MLELDTIYNEDCLEGMKRIPDGSVDAIICDLPYGTTACAWDSVIPFEPLWEQYKRIVKPNAPIVLFSQQPFTSALIMSNIEMYKYNWIWQKDNASNFLLASHQPLKVTEDICVFGYGATTNSTKGIYLNYNPQKEIGGKPYIQASGKQRSDTSIMRGNKEAIKGGYITESNGERFPLNIVRFNRDAERLHPTQKPVDLLRYLVLTYSNEGDVVLDNCMGSGTTAIACIKEHRHFIGFELDKTYYEKACARIAAERQQLTLF
ncbi:MAG: site-specific DNA-methyltransferase [Bacteroidales bacterium]|nr:site-specific DNA-methyltransferase [Bacteroidales bacterium]